jgi:peptidoglycan/LPS O-acetylase OafA/YrhL
MGERLGYRPALDGVRAVAISLVLLTHLFAWPKGAGFGVDLFFVLSGFLITTLLLEEREREGRVNLGAFYIRRARRLFPALAVVLALYVPTVLIAHREAAKELLISVGVAALYSTNIVMGFTHWWYMGGIAPTWSLAAEEQFYLIWPMLLLLVLRGGKRCATAGLAVGGGVLVWHAERLAHMTNSLNRLTYGPEFRSSIALTCGCLAALLFARIQPLARLLAPLAMIGVVYAVAFPLNRLVEAPTFDVTICVLTALFVVAAAQDGAVARMLALRPLPSLGKISYSLYLWHAPVFFIVGVNAYTSPLGTKLLATAISLVAAIASYRFVEQRFRRPRPRTSPVVNDPVPRPAPS